MVSRIVVCVEFRIYCCLTCLIFPRIYQHHFVSVNGLCWADLFLCAMANIVCYCALCKISVEKKRGTVKALAGI